MNTRAALIIGAAIVVAGVIVSGGLVLNNDVKSAPVGASPAVTETQSPLPTPTVTISKTATSAPKPGSLQTGTTVRLSGQLITEFEQVTCKQSAQYNSPIDAATRRDRLVFKDGGGTIIGATVTDKPKADYDRCRFVAAYRVTLPSTGVYQVQLGGYEWGPFPYGELSNAGFRLDLRTWN